MKIKSFAFTLVIIFTLFILLGGRMTYAAVWPISNSTTPDQITSDYGPRVTSSPGFHYGIDIRAQSPMPVHAIKGGTITVIKIGSGRAGNYVVVGGIRYLHLSKKYNKKSHIRCVICVTMCDLCDFWGVEKTVFPQK